MKQEEKKIDISLIKAYYEKIWRYLKVNDYKSATYIYYNEMPVDLYDDSLDILYNRNEVISDEALRKLIIKVDDRICNSSNDDLDQLELDELLDLEEFENTDDHFNNDY